MAAFRPLQIVCLLGALSAAVLAHAQDVFGSEDAASCPWRALLKAELVDASACYKDLGPTSRAKYSISVTALPSGERQLSEAAGAPVDDDETLQEVMAASVGGGGAAGPHLGAEDGIAGYVGRPRGLAGYNTLLGSTLIGPSYTFTSDPYPLEGAKVMAAAGTRVYKFFLESKYLDKARSVPSSSIVEAVTRSEMRYLDVFDQPIDRFVFWAYPVDDSRTYRDFYDLVALLINRYKGSGKTFYIGHWEGDWAIRHNYTDPVDWGSIHHWRRSLSDIQRAIDTARADLAPAVAAGAGVEVYGYAEANRVLKAMEDPDYACFINQVVPYVNPPLDFISYSDWEIEEAGQRSADELPAVMHAALDFINCHLPPKPCVPQPRVFVGEYGYFLRLGNCSALMAPPVRKGAGPWVPSTPEIVSQRTLWHAAAAVAWGSPMNLFWELYSNEVGHAPDGTKCDKGYWLVNDEGRDEPLMTAIKAYSAAADAFIRAHARGHSGAAPDVNTFRRWAVSKLAELAGYEGHGVALPAVRELDVGLAAIAGGH